MSIVLGKAYKELPLEVYARICDMVADHSKTPRVDLGKLTEDKREELCRSTQFMLDELKMVVDIEGDEIKFVPQAEIEYPDPKKPDNATSTGKTATLEETAGKLKAKLGGTTKKEKATSMNKKGATKTKKTEERKNPTRARDDFFNDQVITLKKKPEAGSELADRYSLFKSGMTVGQALKKQNDKGLRRRREFIRRLWQAGNIEIGDAQ